MQQYCRNCAQLYLCKTYNTLVSISSFNSQWYIHHYVHTHIYNLNSTLQKKCSSPLVWWLCYIVCHISGLCLTSNSFPIQALTWLVSHCVRLHSNECVIWAWGSSDFKVVVLLLCGPTLGFGGSGQLKVVMRLLFPGVVNIAVQWSWFTWHTVYCGWHGILPIIHFDVSYGIITVAW